MNWSAGVRQTHRWVSIVFTVAVIVVSIAAVGLKPPPGWVFFLPLLPLVVLLLTGLYLFVLPYAARRRGGQRID